MEAVMVTMMSTKMTKAGQTTVPKEIRTALGIADDSRVYWFWDGENAYIASTPSPLPEVTSAKEFWRGIADAERQVEAGKTRSANEVVSEMRSRYGR
ncbi:AbrB/MazE/SpoVT family DNA-binding domain-containing protein [Parolsenella sp.]|uniref:AbrB/MazE/SpoVT family DNA-binding domain-containing protein n=1 Tax=Parolsenella sp. TaxID=2083006 RepID=UPI002E79E3A1|nr:AbrB/MazE/SpoVT family DNA-binding domain-containing protein [Parolsenella sp.]